MSKKTDAENQVEDAEGTEAETEAPAAPKVDKRHKMITVPARDESGELTGETRDVKRTEYIRELWATGDYDRSSIRDHLKADCTSEDGAHEVAYQIVNAAVKDETSGGPSEAFIASKAAAKEEVKNAKAAAAVEAKAKAKAAAAAEEAESEEGEDI